MKKPRKRAGAGRPSSTDPKKPVTIRLKQSRIEHIEAKGKELNKTLRELIEEATDTI